MTFIFSAAGTCMPLVVTVSGLTEREMPGEEDFVNIEIPGMCIGGGSVNIKNQSVGHMVLMRDTKGADICRNEFIQNDVLFPGINEHRKHFANFDASSGLSIPPELTAIAYRDGEFSQTHVVTNSMDDYIANGVIANKQHAARTARDQAADKAPIFNKFKKLLPSHTAQNLPVELCPVKLALSKAFKDLYNDNIVTLKKEKVDARVEFAAVISFVQRTIFRKVSLEMG
jgi:hypothetical protein